MGVFEWHFKSLRDESFLEKTGCIMGNFGGATKLLCGNEWSTGIQTGFMRGNRRKWKTTVSTVERVTKRNGRFSFRFCQTGP